LPRERITACLIVQDEQEHLPAALESVAFCDEVVVVDGGSTDATIELARAAGARVIENPWPGYAKQRNVALDAASGEWVIEVDADERVCPRLRASLEAMLAAPPEGVSLALCPLRHRFLGRLIGPSAKYPAYRSRIFRPGAYRHDERREVHEGVEPRERPVILEGDLEHELASSLREALRDMLAYARLESRHVTPPAARGYVTGIVVRPLAKLVYRTVIDSGWRDGWRGMLKISLDVASDALVWVFVLGRRRAAAGSGAGGEHFGRRRVGQPKVLALAAGARSSRAARDWLCAMQAKGLDVVLVTDEPAVDGEIPLCAVAHFRPLTVMRAIDLETQVREVDAVVPFGARARLMRRLLPPTLRPQGSSSLASASTE
jgi:glycosyltransferase involved in cell wall biosynthesis